MKAETVAIIAAVLAVGVAVYVATRKPAQTVIYQAQKRNETEALLTGLGALVEGVGEGIGAVWQPRIGMVGGQSQASSGG